MLIGGSQDKKFFALLSEAARNLEQAAGLFQTLAGQPLETQALAKRLKELEEHGDQCTHELIALLNRAFITPLEREDIMGLAVRLDDVIDGIEATASRLDIYQVDESDPFVAEFARIIQEQTREIASAMDCLAAKQLGSLHEKSERINALENQGDQALRASLEHLFRTEVNPIGLIKKKEIYESLELVTDRAEDVANSLDAVVMKNA